MKLSFSPLLFFSSVHLVSIFEFGTSTPEDSVAASLSGLEAKIDTFKKSNLDAYIPFATEVFSDWVQIHKAVDSLPNSSAKTKFQEQLNALPKKAEQATLQFGKMIGKGLEELLSKLRKYIMFEGVLLGHHGERVNLEVLEIVEPVKISEMLDFMKSMGINSTKFIDAAQEKQIIESAGNLKKNDNQLIEDLVNFKKHIEEVKQLTANLWYNWQQRARAVYHGE